MTFDKKILASFTGCTIVLVVVAIVSFRNSEEFINTNRWVNLTHQVLYELDQIPLRTVDAESGVRGYVISGNRSFLEFFSDSKKALSEHIIKLKRLTRDNRIQQANVDKLEKIAYRRIVHLEECIRLGENGKFEEAQQRVISGEGKQLQDEIRSIGGQARELEQGLLIERSEASENNAQRFNILFVTLLFTIAFVLCVVYVIIIKNIQALRKAEADTNDRNWHLAGSSEIVKRMQKNKSVGELSQTIIDSITSYLDIPIGSLYVKERNGRRLKLQGTHALERARGIKEYLEAGEGIAGQAAVENKEILLRDVDSDMYNVVTSFGDIRPTTILAIPMNFEEKVVGVVELANIRDFTDQQKSFLQTISDSVAIGLMSAQSTEEIKDLLEETQRQAEELEAQQHELRQANDELQAKSDLLERSEAILKTQQEELQQTNIELEEKANMLEAQQQRLQDAKREIEEKAHEIFLSSKYKSEFLANMSHELRTPLNSILILSQLLSENKHERLSDKEVEHARNIYNSGSDLLNLINEILDLSKIEAGKMLLDIEQFTIGDVIENLYATFVEVGKNKSVAFEVVCNDKQIELNSDKQRIEQILKNLLSNAFKFTDRGGTVIFNIAPSDNDTVAFSVIDTGIGIPEGKKQIIFEAFQQADGSTKRKYGGTGLGLSISRELANVLGGRIHLESEEGKGSKFVLLLPNKFDPASVQTLERQVEFKQKIEPVRIKNAPVVTGEELGFIDDDRHGIREYDRVILIIEDDEKFASMLLDFVRERGYKGVIATQGTSGISYARHYHPDAIFLDMKLPVMNGYEVLNHLKKDPDLRHIPVQIISGFDHQKKSLALGAFSYLMKPVAMNDLHSAFDKIESFKNKRLKKLLIIEDNVQQNNAIRNLIGNGDVKTFSVYSGKEAEEMMKKEAFDCIIMDLGLPDVSGFELLEKIKVHEKFNSIPVIIYTGKELRKEEMQWLNKLSDAVIIKTVSSHERLLDETILFLHRVESKLPKEKQLMIRKLHRMDETLKDKVILLVDDDVRNVYSLTNALVEEGVTCFTAENGKVAIDVLNANPGIQLVLMDVMMPEMDGYEATIEIRKDERFSKLPIIALTAKAMKGDKEKCLSVGMSDYIPKPVNVDQLLSLMRVWLYKLEVE